jgi:predicted MFS family arabinose efflux permease
MPAATTVMKTDLQLSDTYIGILGALVYLGLVVGSMTAMPVYNYCNVKAVLFTCLIFNALSITLFTVTNNFYLLCTSRVLVGFF